MKKGMTLLQVLVICVILIVLCWGIIGFGIITIAKEIDKSGGIKSVVERVWNGANLTTTKK